jgi:hypothetical protein
MPYPTSPADKAPPENKSQKKVISPPAILVTPQQLNTVITEIKLRSSLAILRGPKHQAEKDLAWLVSHPKRDWDGLHFAARLLG